jgi:hypothetical protein
MQISAVLAALSAVGLAAAVNPNQQSCKATDFLSNVSYSVTVGVSFNNGSGCNDINNALKNALKGDQNYGNFFCTPTSDNKYTSLSFQAAHNQASKINNALHQMYCILTSC